MAFNAETSKGHQVAMMQAAKEFHFFAKILLALLDTFVHALHGCTQAILKFGLVHSPKSTLAYDVAKVVCCSPDVHELEVPK
jgi:hypothetical protein